MGVKLTDLALDFTTSITYEEWESVGKHLFSVGNSWQWWVGDWLNYGEAKFGETYKQAIDITGKSESSLQSVKSVSAEFEAGRRRKLSWTHHLEASYLGKENQEKLLEKAEKEGMPTSWVRKEVKLIKSGSKEIIKPTERDNKLGRIFKEMKTLENYELKILFDQLKEMLNDRSGEGENE